MKKLFIYLCTLGMLLSLVLLPVSAEANEGVWDDFEEYEVGTSDTNIAGFFKGDSTAEIKEENNNKFLSVQLTGSQAYIDLYSQKNLDTNIYLSVDIRIHDTYFTQVRFYSTTKADVGEDYTIYSYGNFWPNKTFKNIDEVPANMNISLDEWYTVEVYYDLKADTCNIFVNGVKAFDAHDPCGYLGSSKIINYINHFRLHVNGTSTTSAFDVDNMKLGTYSEVGVTPDLQEQTITIPPATTPDVTVPSDETTKPNANTTMDTDKATSEEINSTTSSVETDNIAGTRPSSAVVVVGVITIIAVIATVAVVITKRK